MSASMSNTINLPTIQRPVAWSHFRLDVHHALHQQRGGQGELETEAGETAKQPFRDRIAQLQ
jgi:hypothetical protein